MNTSLILASQSPRRAELLSHIAFDFSVLHADIDERIRKNETPYEAVKRLAEEKALTVQQKYQLNSHSVILASDTVVVIDKHILGKPTDFDDFSTMMKRLSAREHQVMTAICALRERHCISEVVTTDVTFADMSDADIIRYWETNEPQDKAGGYGIQGIGGQFVEKINGSYSAVVGLPLVETRKLLAKFGVLR